MITMNACIIDRMSCWKPTVNSSANLSAASLGIFFGLVMYCLITSPGAMNPGICVMAKSPLTP